MSTTTTPAGWYPQADGKQRYWDGDKWTDNFAPGAVVAPKKPWFKKKRIIIPLLGLAGIIAIASIGGGGTETPSAADQSQAADIADQGAAGVAANQSAADKAAADKAAKKAAAARVAAVPVIGSKVVDGKFQFTVVKVQRVGKILPVAQYMPPVTAQGEFIIVRINVKNVGNEAQMLDSTSQKLVTASGQKLDSSTEVLSLKDADKFFININPGNSVNGAPVLFDVPVGAKLASIELHDSMFSGGVKVAIK